MNINTQPLSAETLAKIAKTISAEVDGKNPDEKRELISFFAKLVEAGFAKNKNFGELLK